MFFPSLNNTNKYNYFGLIILTVLIKLVTTLNSDVHYDKFKRACAKSEERFKSYLKR